MENKEYKLDAALLAARLEFEPVYKDTKGARGKYAKLPAWIDMVVPILAKHKIRLYQKTYFQDGFVLLVTGLKHVETREFEESIMPMDTGELKSHETKCQAEAGLQTYHRRYQIMALLGMCAEDDDNDGYRKETSDSNKIDADKLQGPITPNQLTLLGSLIGKDQETLRAILAAYAVPSIDKMSSKQASHAITALKS